MTISLEEAALTMFRESTPEELFGYCDQQGLKVGKNTKPENLIKKLCATMNLVHDSDAAARMVVAKTKPRSPIFPPMNLDSMLNFGGKKFRIKVSKPSTASPYCKGTTVSINGENPGFLIKYGVPQIVPAPVYRRLLDLVTVTPQPKRNVSGTAVVTIFEQEEMYPVSTIKVEPGTEHLPESAIEWYQGKGVKWINDLDERQLRSVCSYLEIRTRSKRDEALGLDEIRANLFVRLYGWDDPTEEDVNAVQAEAA